MTDEVTATLARVAAALPGGGESRPGQQQMAAAVGRAIAGRRHLVVQAGTGTGKSLAYLVPAALVRRAGGGGHRHQGAPGPAGQQGPAPGGRGRRTGLSFAVLKGRSNYLCRQRVAEIGGRGEQLSLHAGRGRPARRRRPADPDRRRRRRRRWRHRTRQRGRGRQRSARRAGQAAGPLGRRHHHRRPGRARLRAPLPGLGHGLDHRPRVPGGVPVPVRAATASPRTPGPGRPRPTWWWSTPTSTGPTWPAAGPCSPPTRWSCSTRPTRSRRS